VPVPLETPVHVVSELASRGYNADREAVTLLANAPNPDAALARAIDVAPDEALRLTVDHVETALEDGGSARAQMGTEPADATNSTPSASGGGPESESLTPQTAAPGETKGSAGATASTDGAQVGERTPVTPVVEGDMTGDSTGTGTYDDFVAVFRDRYERLAGQLRGRVNHRPTDTVDRMAGGEDVAIVGMVSDVRSTSGGHWLVELEDTNGVFPCLVMKDRDVADAVQELLFDEVIAVEGTLSDDGEIVFVDAIHFPDVPRTHQPATADRHVQAALISDVHVGSQEFLEDAWNDFADWLHTEEASAVEYLLIAGDMVEGVGVYPDQDEELDIVDIYDQYEQFNEHLKSVPGDLEIVMIPGNHDAVRLAEPQPAFDDELRDIMAAHDAQIVSNPATVTIEGVTVLMYHGVSLDEVIAELPDDSASYENPHEAMYQLLRKRHVAPQFGGHTRLAPEEADHLVIDDVPDVFHAGHVHKLGYGQYHNVLTINSGCWQSQTAFQESVNLDPDPGFAPIVDLDTLDLTIRKFT